MLSLLCYGKELWFPQIHSPRTFFLWHVQTEPVAAAANLNSCDHSVMLVFVVMGTALAILEKLREQFWKRTPVRRELCS